MHIYSATVCKCNHIQCVAMYMTPECVPVAAALTAPLHKTELNKAYGTEQGSVGEFAFGVGGVWRAIDLSCNVYWAGTMRERVGGAHSKHRRCPPSSSLIPRRGSALKSRELYLPLYCPASHAHRVARVEQLPPAEERGAAPVSSHQGTTPVSSHQGDSCRRALAMLEHPRREPAAQRRGVEISSGGELFTPVDERLA